MNSAISQSLQIVFVIQAGELELKASLLAASLRRQLGKSVHLLAACPQHADWAHLQPATTELLAKLGVELKHFTPTFAPTYPIGNKIDAMALLEDGRPSIFLDSDILCLSSFIVAQLFAFSSEGQSQLLTLAAKPADLCTWGNDAQWHTLQQGLNLPDVGVRVRTTVDGKLIRPYFNAGMLATYQPRTLATLWKDQCQKIQQLSPLPEPIYPWLDQIGMGVLSQHKVKNLITLDEEWNFPAHLRALPGKELPKLCHYHSPEVVVREPRLLAEVRYLADSYPQIRQLIERFESWQPVLRARLPRWRAKHLQGRDFLITGIPRSGTSLLCKLLSQQPNWLVLNEPTQIIPQLASRQDASGIGLMHREFRQNILLGQAIENKIKDGEMIEDTAEYDERMLYHPAVTGRFFRMGSKNTLAYIASLDALLQLDWPIVAMVRHPLNTLVSWENTFSHLREAAPEALPLTHLEHYGWAGWQRQALAEIAGTQDAALRRVLLWRMLARTLLLKKHDILLWRYEDLVVNPRVHIRQLRRKLGAWGSGPILTALHPRQRDQMENPHADYLASLCQPELRELGYLL